LLVVAKLADQAHTWICRQLAKDADGQVGREPGDEEPAQDDKIPF
jgi:hypothetical protein